MTAGYVPLHSVHAADKCTAQKLLKLATPKSNIRFQTGFDDSNPVLKKI